MRTLPKILMVVGLAIALYGGLSASRSSSSTRSPAASPAAAHDPAGPASKALRLAAGPTGAAAAHLPSDPELARLVGALAELGGSEREMRERMNQAYFELEAMLIARPQLATELEGVLLDADAGMPIARVGVTALAGSGRPEAQEVLVRLVDARAGDQEMLRVIVPTLGFTKAPTPALLDGLRRFGASHEQPGVRKMAVLAMGTVAAQVAADDPATAAALTGELATRLGEAKDAGERATYLGALGNVGSAEAAEAVGRFAQDDSPRVRARAVEALRRSPAEKAEPMLARTLREDPDENVRAAAAWALGQRKPSESGVAMAAEALGRERSEKVAMSLIDELWAGRELSRTLVRDALTRLAASHPVESVRTRARGYLDQLA